MGQGLMTLESGHPPSPHWTDSVTEVFFWGFCFDAFPHQDQLLPLSIKYHCVHFSFDPSGSQVFHKERDYVVKLDFILLRVGETLPSVYKIFSSKPLDEGDLRRLFKSIHSFQVHLPNDLQIEIQTYCRSWTGWHTLSTPWMMISPPLCSPLAYTTQAGWFAIGCLRLTQVQP